MIPISDDLSIPAEEIEFRFSTSSGPGGQHVNRSATRVSLRFDVAHSAALTEDQRLRLLRRLASRLDNDGVLQIHAQETRSQLANREAALRRFQDLLRAALAEPKPRRRTRPPGTAVAERLATKRHRAEIKRDRQPPSPADS